MTQHWLFCSLLTFCTQCHAQTILDKVLDGDTVIIKEEAHSYHLRLLDIDAPELHQAFGKQSKRSLAAICMNASISIQPQGLDHYGRTLGHLYCDNTDASQAQIALGMAWFNARYSNREELSELQQRAQHQGLGLWQDAHPMPPWQWRKQYGQHYRRQE